MRTADEMRQLLVNGGRWHGVTNIQAAVHLLTFTDVPSDKRFEEFIASDPAARFPGGAVAPIAYVTDWPRLVAEVANRVPSSTYRFLNLACSLARGVPVDLREALSGFGHAHARRVAEAVLIATGAAGMWTIEPGPDLAKLEAFRAEMQSGAKS